MVEPTQPQPQTPQPQYYTPSDNLPVTDMGALLHKLLEMDYIPQEIRDEYWVVCSNSLKLSNLKEADVWWLMNQYDLMELRTIRALKGHTYDTKFARLMGMLKMEYFANLHRAIDGFERKTQASQITNTITSDTSANVTRSSGLWGHIKSIFG